LREGRRLCLLIVRSNSFKHSLRWRFFPVRDRQFGCCIKFVLPHFMGDGVAAKVRKKMISMPSEQANKPLSVNGVLAQNLLVARVGANWTQQNLAEASGVSRATIAQIEAGIGDPRLSTIELLAGALGVPVVLLLCGSAEFLALSTVASTPSPKSAANALAPAKLRMMNYLVDSGNPRQRVEAARMGVEALNAGGPLDVAQSVGAAIGSARLPGRGTLLGARLAQLLHRSKTSKSASRSVAPGIPPRESPVV
jgi:transcriptional regulator with XRE-family HTH domain